LGFSSNLVEMYEKIYFLFSFWQTKLCPNKLFIASTKQMKSQGLFNTALLSHAVTWCIMCQLTIIASCSTDTRVQLLVRYCIFLHVRKVFQKLNNTSGRDISSNFFFKQNCWDSNANVIHKLLSLVYWTHKC
jgi:hypothetical protein